MPELNPWMILPTVEVIRRAHDIAAELPQGQEQARECIRALCWRAKDLLKCVLEYERRTDRLQPALTWEAYCEAVQPATHAERLFAEFNYWGKRLVSEGFTTAGERLWTACAPGEMFQVSDAYRSRCGEINFFKGAEG